MRFLGKVDSTINGAIVLLAVAAAVVLGRMKQLQYEVRSARMFTNKLVSQEICMVDSEGNEWVSISASADNAALTFYDKNHDPRITLELTNSEPLFRLLGEGATVLLGFDDKGVPNLAFRDEAEKVIWSALEDVEQEF